jgi:hypothetical protein
MFRGSIGRPVLPELLDSRFRFGREADGTPAASWDWGILD